MNKSWLVSPAAVIAMIVTYVLTMTLLIGQAQWWVIGVGCLCVAWRWSMLFGKATLLKQHWRVMLIIVATVLLAVTAKQIGLLSTMVNLLLLGYGLKFIELSQRRDALVLALVGLLCVGVLFIFNRDIGIAVLASGLIVSNFTLLVAVCAPSMALRMQLRLATKIIALSLPLVAVLFVVMPQLAPLWKMPSAKSANIGLSDSMSPGDIAQLGSDARLAFSVTFDGERPRPQQLYWRALVMEQFDGRRWERIPKRKIRGQQALRWKNDYPQQLTNGISYQIMAKASHQSWLFGLAGPTSSDSSVIETLDYTLYAKRPLVTSKAYQATSYPVLMSLSSLSERQRAINLRYPARSNPKTKAWVQELAQGRDEQALINEVLKYFNQNNFSYTLSPPVLGQYSVDEFLFSTQQGFCSHYASAFGLIMRYAGIPSRVVAGYLGGEWNEDIGYLNVYQYDAHAWNEVWLEGQGWVRVDPTASIAPERVERGLAQSLDDSDSFLADSALSLTKYRQIAWVNRLRTQLANIDYFWSRWLLGYNKQKQNELLSMMLGQVTPAKLIIFSLACFSTVALWLLLSSGFRPRRRTKIEKVDASYQRIVRASDVIGIEHQGYMTPNHYASAVLKLRPDLEQELSAVTSRYNQLKFARRSALNKQDLRTFKLLVRTLLNKI